MSLVVERGYAVRHGYYEETTFGTAPTGTDTATLSYNWGDVIEIDPAILPQYIRVRYLSGSRDVARHVKVREDVNLRTILQPTTINVMQYAIGNISKSVTWWFNFTNINKDLVLTGCKANELTVRGRPGEPLAVTMNWLCKDHSETAPQYSELPSDPGTDPFVPPSDAVLKDGSAFVKAIAFELRIRNNLERVPGWDTKPQAIIEKHREITGSITVTLEDFIELTDIINDTEFSLTLKISSINSFNLTGCKWDEFRVPSRPTDLIGLTLPFTAKSITLA
ncbi:hypothetical protein DRJ17_04485 [Candidatus Woesearchaeota archaeon]|nr:MAG: hypothetical protein DRJ17_04485 [Candidatus Woesearchaeota archaeon]